MLPYIKDDLFLCPVRFPCLGRIKKKSQVISHYGVQQTNPLEALIYVTGQKKKVVSASRQLLSWKVGVV